MIRRLRTVDHSGLIWNLLLLLMCVGALPFTTALMAAYLKGSEGESLAEEVDQRIRGLTLKRGVVGVLPHLLATLLAFVSPYITFAICAAVAVFYALPFASASESPASPAP